MTPAAAILFAAGVFWLFVGSVLLAFAVESTK